MPTRIKVSVSIALVVLSILAYFHQSAKGLEAPAWATLCLGAFMILSIWVFPDVRRHERDEEAVPGPKKA